MGGGWLGVLDSCAASQGRAGRHHRPAALPPRERESKPCSPCLPHRVFTMSTGAVVKAHAKPATMEQAKCSPGPSCSTHRTRDGMPGPGGWLPHRQPRARSQSTAVGACRTTDQSVCHVLVCGMPFSKPSMWRTHPDAAGRRRMAEQQVLCVVIH